jgi:hypothetical protein
MLHRIVAITNQITSATPTYVVQTILISLLTIFITASGSANQTIPISSSSAFSTDSASSPNPVTVSERLSDDFQKLKSEALEQRNFTGGSMLVLGGFVLLGGFNELYSQGSNGLIYIGMSAAMTVGGFLIIGSTSATEDAAQKLAEMPDWRVEDHEERVRFAESHFEKLAKTARTQRMWGAALLTAAGASNIILSTINSPDDPQRKLLAGTGALFGAAGYLDLIIEKVPWSGAGLGLLGSLNLGAWVLDNNAPSKDFLLITGSVAAAGGIARFLLCDFREKAWHDYQAWKTNPKFSIFMAPLPGGGEAALTVNF